MKKTLRIVCILLFTGVLIFLAFNMHSKSGYFNYHSEIWADKAGYYVYLPATINYNFDASLFPDSIDIKTGNGFQLDTLQNKIHTKYFCGVAILESPFYLIANTVASSLGQEANGFSPIYHWSINIAAVFYLVLGFYFLVKFLQRKYSNKVIFPALLAIFLGTNLYYYAIDDTGMSHVYSFFLFSLFLFSIQRTEYLKSTGFIRLFFLGILVGLIVLVRPSNILFLSSYLFLDLMHPKEILERLKRLMHPNIFLPILIGSVLIFIPQLVYWNYLTGSPFYYAYTDEGFNWTNPQLIKLWFAPRNGLFLYTPFFIILLFSTIYYLLKGNKNGWFIIFLFLIISYVFSCWSTWSFGCSFGSRNFVEYLSIFSIPLTFLFQKLITKKWYYSLFLSIIIIALIIANLKMIYSFDECFYGDHSWDWEFYLKLASDVLKF